MKRVYLITNYFHFPQEKDSNRYRELGEMLSKEEEISVEVITSSFYHRTYSRRENLAELQAQVPFKVTFVNECGYKKNICLKRLHSCKVFANSVMEYLNHAPAPDLIYQVVPSLYVASKAGAYAKKHKIPFIIDIQDLWPEAFKMALNIPVISDILFAPLMLRANKIYRNADAICAVSQTNVERALRVNRKCKTTAAVYIGINLKQFDYYANKYAISKSKKMTLAYCGTLSRSYDLCLVIDALSLMNNPPRFLVMGDGSSRSFFEAYAKQKHVDVEFEGFVPYNEMCGKLCACDMTVNPIISASGASIISKHGDYAACGLPVLNTQISKEYCSLVDRYQMGYNILSGNPQDLADKIQELMADANLRIKMGHNSRKCAEKMFDRAVTYDNIIQIIRDMI